MKKIIFLLSCAIGSLFLIQVARAQLLRPGGGTSLLSPELWVLSGTSLQPNVSTWHLGSSATRIAKGWFTDLDASAMTIGGTITGDLTVTGNATIYGSSGITASSTKVVSGTAAAPSMSFTTDTDTGIYMSGANSLDFATAGLQRWKIDANGHLAPGLNNTYDIGLIGTAPRSIYASTTVITSSTQLGLGGASFPTYTFQGDTDTGIWSSSANALNLSVGGSNIAHVSSTGFHPSSNNASDLGTSAVSWRSGYFDTSLFTPDIKTDGTGNVSVDLQNQTFTPAATHNAVRVIPTWSSENFSHTGLSVSPTQNGGNTQTVNGVSVSMTKATAATTLANMNGINIAAPTVAGTVTNSYAIDIADQNVAGITNPRGIRTQAGLANAIVIANSVRLFANAPNTLFLAEDSGAKALALVVGIGTAQSIQTSVALNDTIALQNQTFTPAANHNAVQIPPIWASENFNHTALSITGTQNGANTQRLAGLDIAMTKATAATTLGTMTGILVNAPTITGTVTNGFALDIADQTNAGITTPRAIRTATTGVANAFVWGGSALMFANAANNVRLMDSTNARGIDFNVTAAGNQTVTTTAGDLILGSNSIVNLATANADRLHVNLTNVSSTLAFLAPLGSVGLPSYSFNGDTNNGLWSSAADTLNFSTAGAERMRITSGGFVGIGTDTPSSTLHVWPNVSGPAATTTITFGASFATRGSCVKLKDVTGSGFTYMTVQAGVATFSTVSCE